MTGREETQGYNPAALLRAREILTGRFGLSFREVEAASHPGMRHFVGNPFDSTLLMAAFARDGSPVGYQGIIPVRLTDGAGGTFLAGLSVLSEVRESHRGFGLFPVLVSEALALCKARGYKLAYGFPNEKSYGLFLTHLGFTPVGIAPLMAKPLRPGALLCRRLEGSPRLGRVIGAAAEALGAAYTGLFRLGGGSKDISIREWDGVEQAGPLWEALRKQKPFMCVRDAGLLAWRYRHPGYLRLFGESRSGQGALLFAKVTDRFGPRAGVICELMATDTEGSKRAARALLREAEASMKAEGAEVLLYLGMRGTTARSLLAREGFLPIPQAALGSRRLWMIARSLEGPTSSGPLFDIRNWHLSFTDLDVLEGQWALE